MNQTDKQRKLYFGTKDNVSDNCQSCFAPFFACSIPEAKKHAKDMNLKNFAALSNTVYTKEIDY